jgi:hypothetical protein
VRSRVIAAVPATFAFVAAAEGEAAAQKCRQTLCLVASVDQRTGTSFQTNTGASIRLQATPRRWQSLLGHSGRDQIERYYIHIDGTAAETFERNGVPAGGCAYRPCTWEFGLPEARTYEFRAFLLSRQGSRVRTIAYSSPVQVAVMGVSSEWTGEWNTNYRGMTLTQSGDTVTGTYEFCNGTVNMTVQPGRLVFGTWNQDHPCGDALEGGGWPQFELSADNRRFTGSWSCYTAGEEWRVNASTGTRKHHLCGG